MNRLGLLPVALFFSGIFFSAGCGSVLPGSGSGCDTDGKEYLSKDPAQCERMKFKCDSTSQPFFDSCGCGCEIKTERALNGYMTCGPREKAADQCIQIYQPVCGWKANPSRCFSPGCKQSYANKCFACVDKRVVGYTEGACPN